MEATMTPDTAAGMVAAAKGRIQNLSANDVAAELATGDVLLVDIREPEERAATGMIPGAVPAARSMLEFYADPTSPYHREGFETDRRIILYCASGGRSALATDMLGRLGYAHVAHLDGGIKSWMAADQPVEIA
jgi:rhodanese-related sulfurtransferase